MVDELPAPVTGEPLSMDQFLSLMQEIGTNHGFYVWRNGSRHIKYVRPSFDMRDGKCFAVAFECLGPAATFRWTDSAEPMYNRIMAWLKGEEVPNG